MVMTKAEKARVEELENAVALCWPSYPAPKPMTREEIIAARVKIKAGDGPMDRWRTSVAFGWFYNSYNGGSLTEGWSDGMYHNNRDTTGRGASQNMGQMYRTRKEAAMALRVELSRDYAKKLAAIDRIIAESDSDGSGEAVETVEQGSTRRVTARAVRHRPDTPSLQTPQGGDS